MQTRNILSYCVPLITDIVIAARCINYRTSLYYIFFPGFFIAMLNLNVISLAVLLQSSLLRLHPDVIPLISFPDSINFKQSNTI